MGQSALLVFWQLHFGGSFARRVPLTLKILELCFNLTLPMLGRHLRHIDDNGHIVIICICTLSIIMYNMQ